MRRRSGTRFSWPRARTTTWRRGTIPWNGTGAYTTTSIVFLRDGVVLKSELGSGATVLDMGPVVALGDPVAVVGSGLGSTTVIEGFTIQGGPHIPSWGVVLDSESEDLTIRDCKILEFDARPFSAAAVLHEGKGHTLRIEQSEMGGCRGAGRWCCRRGRL